jgi:hypothetical protein
MTGADFADVACAIDLAIPPREQNRNCALRWPVSEGPGSAERELGASMRDVKALHGDATVVANSRISIRFAVAWVFWKKGDLDS